MRSIIGGVAGLAWSCRKLFIVSMVGLLAACSHDGTALQLDASAKTKIVTRAPVRSVALSQKKLKSSATSRPIVVRLKTRTQQVAYGRGPYICSPSGFGRTSRCVAR
jgi:hypothetical protein